MNKNMNRQKVVISYMGKITVMEPKDQSVYGVIFDLSEATGVEPDMLALDRDGYEEHEMYDLSDVSLVNEMLFGCDTGAGSGRVQ